MNRNIKLSKVLSVIALMLCFALLFCACTDSSSNDNSGDTNPPAGNTPETPDDNTPGNENPGDTDPGDETPDDGKVTYTVNVKDYDGNPVAANASDSYCVAGDCVDQSLSLTFTIEEK